MTSIKRMTALDISAVVKEMKCAVGLKLVNLYSISGRCYLLKFTGKNRKHFIVVESGLRVHLTNFDRETDSQPSGFLLKLRKHLRGCRLIGLQQVGLDRVIDFEFKRFDGTLHLIVELFGAGNVVLADETYAVLAVLKKQSYGASLLAATSGSSHDSRPSAETESKNGAQSDEKMNVKSEYPIGQFAAMPTIESLQAGLLYRVISDKIQRLFQSAADEASGVALPKEPLKKKRSKSSNSNNISNLNFSNLYSESVFGPQLTAHALTVSGLSTKECKVLPFARQASIMGYIHLKEEVQVYLDEEYSLDPTVTMTPGEASDIYNKLMTGFRSAIEVLDKVRTVDPLPSYMIAHDEVDPTATMPNAAVGSEQSLASSVLDSIVDASEGKVSSITVYDEFMPMKLAQHEAKDLADGARWTEFPTFWEAVDLYYTSKEATRDALRILKEKQNAIKKLERVRDEHENRLRALEVQAAEDKLKGMLIEANSTAVSKAIEAVNAQINRGLDWAEVARTVREQQHKLNPIAMMIEGMDLEKRVLTVKLSWSLAHIQRKILQITMHANLVRVKARAEKEMQRRADEGVSGGDNEEDEEEEEEEREESDALSSDDEEVEEEEEEDDEEEEGEDEDGDESDKHVNTETEQEGLLDHNLGGPSKPVSVSLNLDLSAFANAKEYFSARKQTLKKLEATAQASGRALKAAEKHSNEELSKVKDLTFRVRRKPMWFEKFHWFITSENFLVVGGRDSHQNEMLVKRYMTNNDIFIHADLHGSPCVIVRNPTGGAVPMLSLQQASLLPLAHSSAWSMKIPNVQSYWVFASQVSKTPPTGMFLPTGSFMIRGKKNFLHPPPYAMGIAILFRLGDEESILRHHNERYIRGISPEDESGGVTIKNYSQEDDDDDEEQNNKVANTPTCSQGEKQEEEEEEEYGEDSEEIQEDMKDNGAETKEESEVKAKSENSFKMEEEEEEEEEDLLAQVELSAFLNPEMVGATQEAAIFARKQVENEIENEMTNAKEGTGKVSTKISAHMRKQLKKGVPLEEILRAKAQKSSKPREPETPEHSWPEIRKAESLPISPPINQRKKSKKQLAKLAKYKNQDEEDKAAAALLYGIRIKDHKEADKVQNDDAAESEANKRKENRLESANAQNTRPRGKENRRELVLNTSNEEQNEDEIKIAQESTEGTDVLLRSLTGKPKDEDMLLYAVPMLAPYQAVQDYKYKAKIVPGPGKKGRMTSDAMHIFQKIAGKNQREVQLLKQITDQDIVSVLVVGKISSAGAASLQQTHKAKKKENAKKRDK